MSPSFPSGNNDVFVNFLFFIFKDHMCVKYTCFGIGLYTGSILTFKQDNDIERYVENLKELSKQTTATYETTLAVKCVLIDCKAGRSFSLE